MKNHFEVLFVAISITIWKFRKRLAETGTDKEVGMEMKRQLDSMKLKMQNVDHTYDGNDMLLRKKP